MVKNAKGLLLRVANESELSKAKIFKSRIIQNYQVGNYDDINNKRKIKVAANLVYLEQYYEAYNLLQSIDKESENKKILMMLTLFKLDHYTKFFDMFRTYLDNQADEEVIYLFIVTVIKSKRFQELDFFLEFLQTNGHIDVLYVQVKMILLYNQKKFEELIDFYQANTKLYESYKKHEVTQKFKKYVDEILVNAYQKQYVTIELDDEMINSSFKKINIKSWLYIFAILNILFGLFQLLDGVFDFLFDFI